MNHSANPQKEKELMIGAGVLCSIIVLLMIAKYLPIFLLSIVPGFLLSLTLERGSFKERCLRYLAVFLILTYVLMLFIGVPKTPYLGVLGSDWIVVVTDFILKAWNGWFQSVGKILKGVARENIVTRLTADDVQQYFLLLLPVSAGLSALISFVRHLKKSESPPQPVGDGAVRFWRRVCFFQVFWPFNVSFEKPGFSILMGFLGSVAVIRVKESSKALGLLLNAHLTLPLAILAFVPIFVFTRNLLSNFKLTAPLVHFTQELAISAFYSMKRAPLSKKKANSGIVIGELSGQTGLFQEQKFVLTETNLNYHLQVVGGSGAGKSNFLQLLIDDRIQKGHGLIFVDLKADFETIDWLAGVALSAGREEDLRVFSLTDREISIGYNPVGSGSLNEIHSRIMQSLKWSEEYYRKAASSSLSDILLGLCELREKTGEQFHLKHIHTLLSEPQALDAFCLREEFSQDTREILKARSQRLRTKEGSQEIMGLVNDLQSLIRSSGGKLLTDDAVAGSAIDLMDVIKNRRITYLLMNSMQDKESSIAIGKLFLQDLISTVGRIYREVPESQRQPVTLIVDEFASFATENFIDLINRARGARLGIVVAHQSRGDLKAVSDNFCDQLERNANTKVIFGTDNSDDAEYFASMVGTKQTVKETRQMEEGLLWADMPTGVKSLREVEEFLVHPNAIKRLGQGQAFIVKRQRDQGFGLVNLYPVNHYVDEKGQPIKSRMILESIRFQSLRHASKSRLIELPRLPSQVVSSKIEEAIQSSATSASVRSMSSLKSSVEDDMFT